MASRALALHPAHSDAAAEGPRAAETSAVKRANGRLLPGPLNYRGLGLAEQPITPMRLASEAAVRLGRALTAKSVTKNANLVVDANTAKVDGQRASWISFDGPRLSLKIESPDDLDDHLKVPLLRAEVAHAKVGPCRHLIAVVPDPDASHEAAHGHEADFNVWALVLEGDEAALVSLLDCLSMLGAIRTGLHKSFVVSPNEVGSGGCATVYLAQSKAEKSAGGGAKTSVAIKLASEPGSKSDKALLNEMPFLATAQGHNNIVQFLGLFRAYDVLGHIGTQWALALEFCREGDLKSWIFRRGPQSEEFAAKVQAGVLSAIVHIHVRGIVHRDVKSENILLAEGGNKGVLTDFGVAAYASDKVAMGVRCGSAGYVAPEVLKHEVSYDGKVDVFGMGVTLYYTLSGAVPFPGKDMGQILRRNSRCDICLEANEHLRFLTPSGKNFLLLLLQRSPENRPTAAAALLHAWLADFHDSPRGPSFEQPPVPATQSAPSEQEDAPAIGADGVVGAEAEDGADGRQPAQQGQRVKSWRHRQWQLMQLLPQQSEQQPEQRPEQRPEQQQQEEQQPGDPSVSIRPTPPAARSIGPVSARRRRTDIGLEAAEATGREPLLAFARLAFPRGGRDDDEGAVERASPVATAPPTPQRPPGLPTGGPARWNRRITGGAGSRSPASDARRLEPPAAPNFELQNVAPGASRHHRFRLLTGIAGGLNALVSSPASAPVAEAEAPEREAMSSRDSQGWMSFGGVSTGSFIETPRASRGGSFLSISDAPARASRLHCESFNSASTAEQERYQVPARRTSAQAPGRSSSCAAEASTYDGLEDRKSFIGDVSHDELLTDVVYRGGCDDRAAPGRSALEEVPPASLWVPKVKKSAALSLEGQGASSAVPGEAESRPTSARSRSAREGSFGRGSARRVAEAAAAAALRPAKEDKERHETAAGSASTGAPSREEKIRIGRVMPSQELSGRLPSKSSMEDCSTLSNTSIASSHARAGISQECHRAGSTTEETRRPASSRSHLAGRQGIGTFLGCMLAATFISRRGSGHGNP